MPPAPRTTAKVVNQAGLGLREALAALRAMISATDDLGRIGSEMIEVVPVVAGGVRDPRPCFRLSKVESAARI